MKKTSRVIQVLGRYFVHVEHHHAAAPRQRILLINGALSTTASFGMTVKYLRERYDVITYDGPHVGQSRHLNSNAQITCKEDEAELLSELIDVYNPDFLLSTSWGGVSALLALAQGAPAVRKAVITSFSPTVNAEMEAFLRRELLLLSGCDYDGAANLVNTTIGRHLPGVMKSHNRRYLSTLSRTSYQQIDFHIRQVLDLTSTHYRDYIGGIQTPILFLNGEDDVYTSPGDVRALHEIVPKAQFAQIPGAGHFLDIEGRSARKLVSATIINFLESDSEHLRTEYTKLLDVGSTVDNSRSGALHIPA